MSAYIFEHDGKQFTPDGLVTVDSTTAHNAQLEATELAAWIDQPDETIAYYKLVSETNPDRTYRASFRTHGTVSTWLGTVLGTVTEARVYRHNLGGRFVSLRVTATNGARYYGRASYDSGNVVRLRKAK